MTNYVWRGAGASHSGAWENAANWLPAGVPGADDVAFVAQGVATDDVNQTTILPDNTINPGDQISALRIGVGAALDIGDAAGKNFAIFTLKGAAPSVVLGSLVINAGGASGSEFRASGTIETSSAATTATGSIDINGGKLLALGVLTVAGGGTIAMDGGYIGGSSANRSDTFINRATVTGVGDITGANYYAAPPAVPLSGPLNFNGLTTYNYGTIDATNLVAGANYLTITGGVTYNFGTLEATNSVSGSTGYAALGSNEGAKIVNESSGTIAAMTGAFVTLGAPVSSQGELLVDGGYMTFTGAVLTTGQEVVENGGALYLDTTATVAGEMKIFANSSVIASRSLVTSYGTKKGNVDIDGGSLFALGSLSLTGDGVVNLDGGYISADSLDRVDNVTNRETIAGAGYIDAYNVFNGVGVYNSLVVSNYGTIDATNINAGLNVLGMVGGTLHNYGHLDADDLIASSSGTASVFLDHGAVVINSATGVMDAGAGAFIAMSGAKIENGQSLGQLSIFDTGNVIEATSAVATGFVNEGAIYVNGTLTIQATNNNFYNHDATIQVNAGGKLVLNGEIDNASGTIAVDGGTMTAQAGSSIAGAGGKLIIGQNNSGGAVTLDSPLRLDAGLTTIDTGTLTLHANVASEIYDNGVLGIGSGGSVSGYIGLTPFGAIDLDTVGFNKKLTGTYTQATDTRGVMKVKGETFEILGGYQSVGTTSIFGVDGGPSGFYIQADTHFHNVAQIVYRLNISG